MKLKSDNIHLSFTHTVQIKKCEVHYHEAASRAIFGYDARTINADPNEPIYVVVL